MKYPHKKDLFKVLNREIEFNDFLKKFTKIKEFNSEHPVHSFIFIVKDMMDKNSKDMLSSNLSAGTLFSALNIKLSETFEYMESASETAKRMGEKDIYEVKYLEEGLEFSKKLVDEICYAYSED